MDHESNILTPADLRTIAEQAADLAKRIEKLTESPRKRELKAAMAEIQALSARSDVDRHIPN